VSLFLFKLIVTPLLIGGVSLAGQRWGPTIGGLLVGLPLTSGPVAFFLALAHGNVFAASASIGILAGGTSVVVFCLAYSWLVFWLAEPVALVAGWAIFFGSTWLLQDVTLPPISLFVAVAVLNLVMLLLLPRGEAATPKVTAPRWEIPARMVLATVFVLVLTGVAASLGPRLSGLLAPFPIFISTLGAFTHQYGGPTAVAHLIRGVAIGLFGFTLFFLVVSLLLVPAGLALAFIAASLVTLATQGAALWLMGRRAA
jgi:hypothetical protein